MTDQSNGGAATASHWVRPRAKRWARREVVPDWQMGKLGEKGQQTKDHRLLLKD